MTLKIWNNEFGTDYDLNNNFNSILSISLQNHIRSLVVAAQSYGKDGKDIWGEAYTSNTGRNSYVVLGTSLIPTFDTNRYKSAGVTNEAPGDTTHDPDSFTNPSNFFDQDFNTYASKSYSVSSGDGLTLQYSLGKTFAPKLVKSAKIKVSASVGYNKPADWCYVSANHYLQTYDGGSWTTIATLATGGQTAMNSASVTIDFDDIYAVNATISGLRISSRLSIGASGYNYGFSWTFYELEYGNVANSELEHTIPAGTFASDISSAFATVLYYTNGVGDNMYFKLTNTLDDTGWLLVNKVQNFRQFSSEPTKITLRFSTSNTESAGIPAIHGMAVRCA